MGRLEPSNDTWTGQTAIDKRPVDVATLRAPGPKRGGLGSGLVGDSIGDPRHHGGDRQAVYAFAREELDYWEGRLGGPLASRSFGENQTTTRLDVDASLVGDRWAVGDEVVLEVTGPRIPCRTFAAWLGVRGWIKTFAEIGRTGAYLSVVAGGEVRPGDEIWLVSRPEHDIDVPLSFRAFMGDLDAAERLLAAEVMPEWEVAGLRETVERRRAMGA
jgi:MOSC domain-containing protein YiiM